MQDQKMTNQLKGRKWYLTEWNIRIDGKYNDGPNLYCTRNA